MGYARKIVFRSHEGDTQKYTGTPPSKGKEWKQGARGFDGELNDDDPQVCLNCDMPPERCHGTDECYRRAKNERERTLKQID